MKTNGIDFNQNFVMNSGKKQINILKDNEKVLAFQILFKYFIYKAKSLQKRNKI